MKLDRTAYFLLANALIFMACVVAMIIISTESRYCIEDGVFFVYPKHAYRNALREKDINMLEKELANRNMSFSYETVADLLIKSGLMTAQSTALYTNADYVHMNKLVFTDGWFFTEAQSKLDVIVLSEALAWKLFGNVKISGQQVMISDKQYEVVGVVSQENMKDVNYFVWLPLDIDEVKSHVENLYIQPAGYNKIDSYTAISEAIDNMADETGSYHITDMNQYVSNIAKRPVITLSLLGLYVIFIAVKILAAQMKQRNVIQIVICTALIIMLIRFVDFNIWVPGFNGGGFQNLLTTLANIGMLPDSAYLSYSILILNRLNIYSNCVFIVSIISFINIIFLTKIDTIKYALNKCVVPFILIFTLTACSAVETKEPDTVTDAENVDRITVSYFSEKSMDTKIAMFEALYPEYKIDAKNYSSDYGKYYEQLQIKLMTNDADDLFEVTGLPFYEYAEKGLLTNFYDLMDKDELYRKDDFFPNILETMKYKNGLYAYPKSFDIEYIAINKNAPAELIDEFMDLSAVNYSTLVDLHRRFGMESRYYIEPEFTLKSKVYQSIVDYVDFENKRCDFNNQRFIQSLKDYKEFAEPKKEDIIPIKSVQKYDVSDTDLSSKYLFRKVFYYEYDYFINYEGMLFTHPIPIVNDTGKVIINTYNAYSIYQGSDKKEAAWIFAEYLASRLVDSAHTIAYPINKTIFSRSISGNVQNRIFFTQLHDLSGQYAIQGNVFRRIEEISGYVTDIAEMPARLRFPSYDGFDLVMNEIDLYLKGFINAEQAANNIQDKVAIMLSE